MRLLEGIAITALIVLLACLKHAGQIRRLVGGLSAGREKARRSGERPPSPRRGDRPADREPD